MNINNKKWNMTVILFFLFMTYKLSLEFGYWYVLREYFLTVGEYSFDFNFVKYVLGFITVVLVFFFIDHTDGKVSTFFLDLHYVLAIIPLTVIYAFGNKETLYYIGICICYMLAIMVVRLSKDIEFSGSKLLSTLMIFAFYIITMIVYIDMIIENGTPSLGVLNIFRVYEYRENFQINQYVGYLYRWQVTVINPVMIVGGLQSKKWFNVFVFTGLQFVAYLYSTQKTILFIIPLVYIIYFLGKKKNFYFLVYGGFSLGLVLTSLLAGINYNFYKVFSLFGRRVLLLPANLKFLYYDYYTNHDVIGLAGTLWGKLLDIEFPYNMGIGNLIASYYFGRPETSSNTGFLAEGFYRFGYLGIIVALILFAFLLKCIDLCEKRNGFSFAVGVSLFSIFMLNDTSLIDYMIFGNITVLLFVLLFYEVPRDRCSCNRDN